MNDETKKNDEEKIIEPKIVDVGNADTNYDGEDFDVFVKEFSEIPAKEESEGKPVKIYTIKAIENGYIVTSNNHTGTWAFTNIIDVLSFLHERLTKP